MSLGPASRPTSPTVLLVDDEEGIRSVLKSMLELLGYQVLVACDGLQAIKIHAARNTELSLVVSDFRMPGMDGVETLTTLRKLHPGLKAILCSGTPESECLQGRTLEDCVYLAKPFNFGELNAAVEEVLA